MVPLSSSSSSASASSPPPRPLTATVASTHALSQPIPALHAPLLPSSFSSDEPPLTLYEDGYLKLTPTKLKVKCYFFPFGLAKTIPLKDIKKVSEKWEEGEDTWKMRWWPGMEVAKDALNLYSSTHSSLPFFPPSQPLRSLSFPWTACGKASISTGVWPLIFNVGGLAI